MDNEETEYDKDDAKIRELGINVGQDYCTECKSWYDVTTESDRHAH